MKTMLPPEIASLSCSTQKALTVLGNKWTLFILREFLYMSPTQRFNELLRTLKPISSRTLSARLKKLESFGLIERCVVGSTPVAVEYRLTPKGRSLELTLRTMGQWFKVAYR